MIMIIIPNQKMSSSTANMMYESMGDLIINNNHLADENQSSTPEYTYSEKDKTDKYDRKRQLERHSSSDFVDANIEKLIELSQQNTQISSISVHKPVKRSSIVDIFLKGRWLGSKLDMQKFKIENLGDIKRTDDIISALQLSIQSKNNEYMKAALDMITNLCEQDESKAISSELGSFGVCGLIDQILTIKIDNSADSTINEACLRTICSLITVPKSAESWAAADATVDVYTNSAYSLGECYLGISSNRKNFSSHGPVYRIVKVTNNHIQDEIVLEWGLRVLFYLSLEPGLVNRILSCGGCDLCTQALKSHSANDMIIVWSCRLLSSCVLSLDAKDRSTCQDRLAQQKTLQTIITEFNERMDVMDILVAQWLLKAIGSIARYHPNNCKIFIDLDICSLMSRIIESFANEDEKKIEFLYQNLCWIVGNMSYPSAVAQTQWSQSGACEMVLETLTKYVHNQEVVQEALRALRNLCYEHEKNLEYLQKLGVVSVLMVVIKYHKDFNEGWQVRDTTESSAAVLPWVWYAIAALSDHAEILTSLASEGVCEHAVSSMSRFSSRPDLVQWVALAISKIATNNSISETLGNYDCCAVLTSMLNLHIEDADVLEEILTAILNLTSNNYQNRCKFHAAQAVKILSEILRKHEVNEVVVEAGLISIDNILRIDIKLDTQSFKSFAEDRLSSEKSLIFDQIIYSLITCDGCKTIANIIQKYVSNSSIVESGCRVLSNVSLYGTLSYDLDIQDISVIEAKISIFQSASLYHHVEKAEEVVLIPLGVSTVATALNLVLEQHLKNEVITEFALSALQRMSTCVRNIPVLHLAGIDRLISIILRTHFLHQKEIVKLCYKLIINLCVDSRSRLILNTSSGGEALLVSLAHNFHSDITAKLGCDALSALCISPLCDGLCSLFISEKESSPTPYSMLDWNTNSLPKSIALPTFSWLSISSSGILCGVDDVAILQMINSGLTAVLHTILVEHTNCCAVLISAFNALNSLAIFAEHRNCLNNEDIFHLLSTSLSNCVTQQIAYHDGDVLTDTTDSSHVTIEEDTKKSNNPDDSNIRSILLNMLNLTIGTLCLPQPIELNGLNLSAGDQDQDSYSCLHNQLTLGTLGVCEMITECLKFCGKNSMSCEPALRAIYYLIKDNSENQCLFGEIELHKVILVAINNHIDHTRIIAYAILCISYFALNNKKNSMLLKEVQFPDILMKLMKKYLQNIDVVGNICFCIYSLKALNDELLILCEYVVQALNIHNDVPVIAQYACRAISSLSEMFQNKIILDHHNICSSVTNTLNKYASSSLMSVFVKDANPKENASTAVAQWSCNAIYFIARGLDSELFQQKLVQIGACEAVTKALIKYSDFETIAHACFRALVVLLVNNIIYQTKLGAAGVCACIVESMHMFPYSALVAKWGCRAAAVLAEKNESNIAKLGAAGACYSIPVILQSHPSKEYVASAGCDVISFMSETLNNGYASRFGQSGACEAVVNVLQGHPMNPFVVTRASIALASLARVKGNATWLGPTGACDAIMVVLKAHYLNAGVVKFIISAIGNLCIIENNKERLGSVGVCELLVEISNIHLLDLDVTKATALAMGKLCETIQRSNQSQESLTHVANIGVMKARKSLSKNFSSKALLKDGEDESSEILTNETNVDTDYNENDEDSSIMHKGSDELITTVSQNEASIIPSSYHKTNVTGRINRSKLFNSGYCAVLVKMLDNHMADSNAAKIICRTIYTATSDDTCGAERDSFALTGVCTILAKTMQIYDGDEAMGRIICWTIKSLSYHHHRNREELRKAGICGLVLIVLRSYRYSRYAADTVESAASAIANLCQDNVNNKIAMGSNGCCEGLLEALELHHRNPEAVYLCVRSLFHLCDGNYDNLLKISVYGGTDILMSVLNKYSDEERILDYVFSVMIGMSFCPCKVGQSKLSNLNTMKLIIAALYRYEKTSEYISLLCCVLIHSLVIDSTENQKKMSSLAVNKAVTSVLIRYARSTAFEFANKSQKISHLHNSQISDQKGDEYIIDQTEVISTSNKSVQHVFPLSLLIGELSVLKECSKVIFYICIGNDEIRSKFQATSTVLDALSDIVSNQGTISDETLIWVKRAIDVLV